MIQNLYDVEEANTPKCKKQELCKTNCFLFFTKIKQRDCFS